MSRTACLALAGSCLAACGPESLIEVTVAADLTIPREADRLELWVIDPDAEILSADEIVLEAGETFPRVILYEPRAGVATRLRHGARVSLGEVTVASAVVSYEWSPGKLNEVVIQLPP